MCYGVRAIDCQDRTYDGVFPRLRIWSKPWDEDLVGVLWGSQRDLSSAVYFPLSITIVKIIATRTEPN